MCETFKYVFKNILCYKYVIWTYITHIYEVWRLYKFEPLFESTIFTLFDLLPVKLWLQETLEGVVKGPEQVLWLSHNETQSDGAYKNVLVSFQAPKFSAQAHRRKIQHVWMFINLLIGNFCKMQDATGEAWMQCTLHDWIKLVKSVAYGYTSHAGWPWCLKVYQFVDRDYF